jgi:hypothetical protein
VTSRYTLLASSSSSRETTMKKETKAERDARHERTLANAARTRALAERAQAELDKQKQRAS